MGHISKTQEKRWFCIISEALTIHIFGITALGSVLDTGQPELEVFLTEDELEIYVNSELGAGAYKEAIDTGSERFMGTSQKYPMPTLV